MRLSVQQQEELFTCEVLLNLSKVACLLCWVSFICAVQILHIVLIPTHAAEGASPSILELLHYLSAELHTVLTCFVFDISTSFCYFLADDLMDLNIYRHLKKSGVNRHVCVLFFKHNLWYHQEYYFVTE